MDIKELYEEFKNNGGTLSMEDFAAIYPSLDPSEDTPIDDVKKKEYPTLQNTEGIVPKLVLEELHGHPVNQIPETEPTPINQTLDFLALATTGVSPSMALESETGVSSSTENYKTTTPFSENLPIEPSGYDPKEARFLAGIGGMATEDQANKFINTSLANYMARRVNHENKVLKSIDDYYTNNEKLPIIAEPQSSENLPFKTNKNGEALLPVMIGDVEGSINQLKLDKFNILGLDKSGNYVLSPKNTPDIQLLYKEGKLVIPKDDGNDLIYGRDFKVTPNGNLYTSDWFSEDEQKPFQNETKQLNEIPYIDKGYQFHYDGGKTLTGTKGDTTVKDFNDRYLNHPDYKVVTDEQGQPIKEEDGSFIFEVVSDKEVERINNEIRKTNQSIQKENELNGYSSKDVFGNEDRYYLEQKQLRAIEEGAKISQQEYERQVKEFGKDVVDAYGGLLTYDEQEVEKAKQMQLRFMQLGYGEAQSLALAEKYMATQKQDKIRKSQNVVNYISAIAQQSATGEYSSSLARYKEDTQFTPSEQQVWQDIAQNPLFGDFMDEIGYKLFGNIDKGLEINAATTTLRKRIVDTFYAYQMERFNNYSRALVDLRGNQAKKNVRNAIKEDNGEAIYKAQKAYEPIRNHLSNASYLAEDLANKQKAYDKGFDLENERNLDAIKEYEDYDRSYIGAKLITKNILNGAFNVLSDVALGVMYPFSSNEKIGTYLSAADYTTKDFFRVMNQGASESYEIFKDNKGNQYKRVNDKVFVLDKNGNIHYNEELTYNPTLLNQFKKVDEGKDFNAAGIARLLTNQIGMMYGAETIAGKLATKTVGAVGTMKYARNVAKAIDIVGKDSQLVKNMNLYSSVKGVYSSAAWGEMVAKNNFVEAKNAGLDNKQAFIYSLFQNVGTMALIHVSPDAKFFKEYETASKDLIKLISKNKWQEAGLRASNALKVIGSGIRSENLQEITEQVYNDAVNVVTNTITKSEQLDAFSFDTYDQTVRDTTLVTLFLGGTNAMLRKGKSNVQINIDGLNKLQQYIVASVTPDIDTYLDKIQGGFLGYTEKQVTETKAAIAKVRKYVEQIPKDMPIDIQLGEEIVLSMERIDNYKQQLSKTDNEVIIDEIKKKLDKENEFLRTLFQNRYDNTKEYHNNSNTDAETNHNDDIKNNNTNDETTEDSHFEPSKETVVEKDEAITINNTPNTSVNNDVPYSTTTTENTEDNDKLNSDINEDEVLDSILNNPTFSVDNDNAIEQELENASDNSPAITNDKLDTKLNSNPTDTQIEIKPLSEISTDENRFQARKKLNETVINNIANNYSEKDQDPIHVWQDPKDGKTYVLSGHHRYYGAKQAGRNDVKIIDRTKDFTEEEAIRFAKEEANANRSMETPLERAATLRQKRERNDAQEDINNFLNREGKNKRLVHNLSYLNPKGKAVQSVASFENSSNSDSKRETEKIADWIGEARRIFGDKLTDAHENEMFDFLNDKEASKRFSKKGDFVEKVRHIVGGMYYDSNAPLNLKRIENKGNAEMEYENEMRELKNKAAEYDAQISNIDDRFTNAKREDYISPDAKDFKEVKEIARKEKERLKNEQKAIYSKIDKLQREKGKYIKADIAQPTLFQKGNVNTKTISKKAFDELIERLKKPFAKAFKNLNVTTDWETFKNRLNALGNVGNLEDLAFFQNLSRVNEKFNKELDQLIKGTLPKGHIFQLGKPSPILKSSGIPDLPIELNADRLKRKSEQENHLFDLENVKNLSTAIQYPIAVFDSTKKDGSKVILTDIKDKKGSNYVVAMRLSHKGRGRHQIEINDIKSVYPKEHYLGIIDWINSNDNLLKFADKEKVLNYISVQSTNLIGNGNIAKDGTNVHQKVEKAKQSIQDFQNPISDKEISDIQFNKIKLMQTPNGEIYGAKLPDGTIYINPNKLNANTPIHEFSHLWEQLMPNAWKRGVELLKQTKIGKDIFGKLKSEGNYQNLTDEQLWSEALNTHIGNYGEWQYHSTALQKLGQWLKNLFQKLGDFIKYKGKLSPDTKLNDFTKGVLGDLLGNNELIGEEGFNHHKGETQYSKQDLRHAAKEMIGKVVSLAFNRKKGTESITVGYFNDYAKSLIEEVSGLKLKHRVSFEINESDVRHSIKEHFGKNETDSRNHPIQKEDYDKILDIASNPDRIVYIGVDGKTGLKLFSFQKEYENGDFAIVKFIGKSGGRLSFKTFYQNKKGIHQRQNADLKQSPSANAQTRSVAFPSYDANVQNLLNFETDTNKEYVDNHINNDNNDIRFQIIGKQGAENLDQFDTDTNRISKLQEAEEMELSSNSPKEIRIKTGWERGADGEWRYEIPDIKPFDDVVENHLTKTLEKVKTIGEWFSKQTGSKVKEGMIQLGDFAQKGSTIKQAQELGIELSPLFEAYPQLKDIKIKLHTIEESSSKGSYKTERELFFSLDNNAVRTISIREDLSPTQANATLIHEIQHAIQDIEGFAKGGNGTDVDYKRKAGEVEARNVQNRAYMSAEQRQQSTLQETEDTTRDEQIISKEAGVQMSIDDMDLYDNLMPITTLQSVASAVQENDLAKAKSILENSSWYKGLSQKDKKLVDGQSVKNVVVQQAKKRQEYKKLQTPEGIKEVFENKINQYKNAKLDTRSKIALKREAQRQAAYAIKQYVVKNRMKKKLMPGQANRLIKLATEISYPRQNLKSVYGKIEKFIATYEAIKEKNISATKQEPKTTYEESKTTYEKVNAKLEKGVNLEDFKNIDERKTAERILERERAKTAPEGEGFKIQEEAFEASENKIKEKKPIKEIAVKISRQAAQSISDRQFVPKLLLEASGMDNAYDRFVNVQGANGRAQKWMDKLNEKVYDGIYGKEYQMLNKIIDARATISIDQYREKEGLPPIDHHNGFNQYYAQDALNGIKEALGNKRFDELNNRASAYFAFHHEIVDKLQDNGIISEDTAKILKAREYSPRFFLEHMEDFEGNIDQQHSEIFNNSSGKLSKGAVQSLGEGSKGLKINDTQYLMTNYVNKMSQLIAQNELNKTFAVRELPKAKQRYEVLKNQNKLSADERRFVKYFKELESKVVLNPITGITPSGNLKYEHDAAPKGFSKNYYYDDGVRQEFFLANELHDQWNDLNKGLFKSGDIKEVTSILTGVAMNKATATGYNPVFFLTNTPRDFLMVSTISNEYSSFKPIAWVQTLKDATIGIMEKRKFSKGENSLLEKYIEYGGMMDFLNKQGVIRNDGIIDNIISYLFGTDQMKKKRKFSLRKTLSRLNVLNDYSEVMFRVGLMNRTLNNQLKAYNKEHNTNYKSVEELDQQTKDDMYHRAVREARSVLDFNQGGTITKDLDGVLSYANVMVQGPRVVADAFRKNPVKTTVNMLQTSTILPALKYGFSMGLIGLFRDDDDELSNTEIYLETLNGVNESVRRSNFIFPLGKKDEEGNWRFLAIAKPQELQPLFTLTERLIENHLRESVGRKPLDWNLILRDVNRSFDSALPVNPIHNPFGNDSQLIDLSSKSPGIKASIIAGYGINPFTKQPVSSDVGKVSLSQEGMNDSRIEGFYKTLFPIIGISPARAKAFIESFITQPTTNTYVHIGYSILDLVTGNGDLEKFKNNLYKTATRRVIRETSEFNYKMNLDNEYETELENIKESADKNNAELKSLVKYAIDNNLESYEAYDYFESKIEQMNLSETEKKAYYKKAKDNFKQRNTNYTTDKYDSMLYSIRNESDPEVKAKMIKVYFGDDIPEEVRERGKQLGNIFTKRVNKILEEDAEE
ncbi:ParB N-terminal domain-containing protein [Riemerella anatipestifer]|nr:ParB N-terminal domain-containing protein [Riemerella anatipestifer]